MVLGSHSPIHTWNIYRQRLVEVSLSSGNYSRLLADVIFTRSMGYYMIQVIWGYFRILYDTGSFWIFRDIIWYKWVLTIVLREENWENNIPKGTKGPGIQCLDSFDWFNLIINLCYQKREYFAQKWFSTSTCKRIDQEWRSAKKSPEDAHSSSFLYFSDFRWLQYCIWIITSGAERGSGASRRWGNP